MERGRPALVRQTEVVERQWGALSDGLLDLARITTGDRVLDLACGVGDPALAAARRVGPTGTVIATDLSSDMLAFAARRAAAAGLGNVQTHEMDAEAIDLPDESVDAVVCRLGLMFLPDLDRAIAGVSRVLVPGGRFAAAMPWRPADNAMPVVAGEIVGALGLAAGGSVIFSLADAAVVCAALERAGLVDVRVTPYVLDQHFRSPEEWVEFLLTINVPLRQAVAGVSDERIRQARRQAIDVAARYVGSDGEIHFPGYGYYASAVRSAR